MKLTILSLLSLTLFNTNAKAESIKVMDVACQVKLNTTNTTKAVFVAMFPKDYLDSHEEIFYRNSVISTLYIDGKRVAELSEDIKKNTLGVYRVGDAEDRNNVIESFVIFTDYTLNPKDKVRLGFAKDNPFFGIKKGTYMKCKTKEYMREF